MEFPGALTNASANWYKCPNNVVGNIEKQSEATAKSSLAVLIAIGLFLTGSLFAFLGILFPKGDLQAIALGVNGMLKCGVNC